MFFINHIKSSYVILVGLLLATSVLANPQNPSTPSPWSGLPIKNICEAEYRSGLLTYQEAVESKVANFAEFFSNKAKEISSQCQEDYSLGLLDARMYLQQSILLEYALEMDFAAKKFGASSPQFTLYKKAMKGFFAQKLSFAFLDPKTIEATRLENSETKKGLAQMAFRLIGEARRTNKSIQFGRFIFTPKGRPYTSFEYLVSSEGKLEELPSGELKVEKGSYQKKAEMIIQSAIEVAQAYVDYRPKMVLGEDSLLTATLEEMILGTEFNKTLRGVREATPFEVMTLLVNMAKEMQLNLKPLLEIQRHMIDKQNAVLERDIKATRVFLTGVVLLPLVPYAIRFGSWALSSYGARLGLSYVAEGGAWKLSVGSFLYTHATTISVLSSLLAVVGTRGIQVYGAIEEHRKDPNGFTLGHVVDAIMVSVVSAVPLAIGAPIVVAAGAAGTIEAGSFLASETTQFLAQAANGFRYAQAMGWRQALVEVAKAAPSKLLKTWCNAWWTRGPTGIIVNTKFIAMVASYNATSVIAEITTREMRSDPEQKFWTPHGINKLSIYNLTQKALVSIITAPIIKLDNFWARWGAWRIVELVSNGLITYVIDGGKVNTQYVMFESVYGATVSSAFGESERVLQMAILNSGMSAQKSFWVQTVLKMAIMFPKAGVRNFAMDIYMGRIKVDHDSLLKTLKGGLGFEFKNFSEAEINQGLDDFRKDVEVLEMMKIPLSELQNRYSVPR